MPGIDKSYIGVGKLHARPFGTTGKFREIGNVSAADITHELNSQRQPDYQRSGGGTLIRYDRITSVALALTMLTFSAENWALATAGTSSVVATATVVDEVVKGYKDSTVKLLHPPASITAVTNSAATTTYAAGTDYVMAGVGLYFPAGSTITEAADLKVDYTSAPYTRIEGAMGVATELEMFFDGLNEVDEDKPFLVDLWRVSLPNADQISLIGQELGEFQFSAELLKDSSKGSGVSAFYRARQV